LAEAVVLCVLTGEERTNRHTRRFVAKYRFIPIFLGYLAGLSLFSKGVKFVAVWWRFALNSGGLDA